MARLSPEAEARRIAAVIISNKARIHTPQESAKRSASMKAAWKCRKANGPVKIESTPEEKARKRARIAEMMADPEIEARRRSNLSEALSKLSQKPERRAALSKAMRKHFAKPGKLQAHRERAMQLWSDPQWVEKTRAAIKAGRTERGIAKSAKNWATPKARIAAILGIQRYHAEKRGFVVPASRWKEYRFLTCSKGLTAREAGRAMGLLQEMNDDVMVNRTDRPSKGGVEKWAVGKPNCRIPWNNAERDNWQASPDRRDKLNPNDRATLHDADEAEEGETDALCPAEDSN